MSQRRFQQVDGLIGIGRNSASLEFYLRVETGEVIYEDDEEREEYIQMYRYQTAAAGADAVVSDMFETDELEDLVQGLTDGRVSWYGEDLAFRPATADEKARIRAVTGW
ncbi:hypothetical protein SGLAM104S_05352 [Streptomyces glaucescens]